MNRVGVGGIVLQLGTCVTGIVAITQHSFTPMMVGYPLTLAIAAGLIVSDWHSLARRRSQTPMPR